MGSILFHLFFFFLRHGRQLIPPNYAAKRIHLLLKVTGGGVLLPRIVWKNQEPPVHLKPTDPITSDGAISRFIVFHCAQSAIPHVTKYGTYIIIIMGYDWPHPFLNSASGGIIITCPSHSLVRRKPLDADLDLPK